MVFFFFKENEGRIEERMEEGKQGRAEISSLSQPKQNIARQVEQIKYVTVQGSSTMARPPQQK